MAPCIPSNNPTNLVSPLAETGTSPVPVGLLEFTTGFLKTTSQTYNC